MKLDRLRRFVTETTMIVSEHLPDDTVVARIKPLLTDLVAHDDWLPEQFSVADSMYYQQYLLHCDPLGRFSVISFVWGPGQSTPVHDHTVWGLIGMLRGAEHSRGYRHNKNDEFVEADKVLLQRGEVVSISPAIGDIHQVSNAMADQVSISIHVYGANIGAVKRHVFDPKTGAVKDFVSGYTNSVVPNLWDRSAEARIGIAAG
jgi:predicted metal-dependent enzyme (double-stranded beta helix superfamily)